MLSAYVLIQTEVGKVAQVARALSDLDGVQVAENLAGPDDVIARVQAPRSGSAGPAGGLPDPAGGRGHPHPDLHGAPSVAALLATASSSCRPARAAAQLWPRGMPGGRRGSSGRGRARPAGPELQACEPKAASPRRASGGLAAAGSVESSSGRGLGDDSAGLGSRCGVAADGVGGVGLTGGGRMLA